MFYNTLKIFIRLALNIFCKKIRVNNRHLLNTKGPLLLTVNHPNGLLDAIIIGALFKQPVHYLTRGDVFNTHWKRKMMGKLNMIPIYRLSEGSENLHLNQFAFDRSKEVLKKNGIVLIFIEGFCKHTHTLQPLKKGAARIAYNCWKEKIPLQILPITIRYNSLYKFGKNILVQLVPPFTKQEIMQQEDDAKNYLSFNKMVNHQLLQHLREPISTQTPSNFLMFLPAMLGIIIHASLYYPIKSFVEKKTNGNQFYDSVLFGLLLFLYPIFLLLFSIIIYLFTKNILVGIGAMVLFPITAWCAVRYKN